MPAVADCLFKLLDRHRSDLCGLEGFLANLKGIRGNLRVMINCFRQLVTEPGCFLPNGTHCFVMDELWDFQYVKAVSLHDENDAAEGIARFLPASALIEELFVKAKKCSPNNALSRKPLNQVIPENPNAFAAKDKSLFDDKRQRWFHIFVLGNLEGPHGSL